MEIQGKAKNEEVLRNVLEAQKPRRHFIVDACNYIPKESMWTKMFRKVKNLIVKPPLITITEPKTERKTVYTCYKCGFDTEDASLVNCPQCNGGKVEQIDE